jgi:hypothetical protein
MASNILNNLTEKELPKMGKKVKTGRKTKVLVETQGIQPEVVLETVTEIPDTVLDPVVETVVEPTSVVEETPAPVVAGESNEEKLAKLKEHLLANLNNPEFVLPFFSEPMFQMLVQEGKVVNVPVAERVSGYHSLPFQMPYDEERKARGFSGKRGRMFFSLVMNKTSDELIALESFNRVVENNHRLEPMLYRKTLQAMAKGYFPAIHAEFKVKYPVVRFKPAAPITVVEETPITSDTE